jgi:hypothetical protein
MPLAPQEFVSKWKRVLFAAYGWPSELSDEILAKLLALNLERAKG